MTATSNRGIAITHSVAFDFDTSGYSTIYEPNEWSISVENSIYSLTNVYFNDDLIYSPKARTKWYSSTKIVKNLFDDYIRNWLLETRGKDSPRNKKYKLPKP